MRIQRAALPGVLLLIAAASLGTAAGGGRRAPKPSQAASGAAGKKKRFQLRVERNVVQVRVGVLNSRGKPVRGLTRDDFLLFDNGKRQVITGFSVHGVPAPGAAAPTSAAPSARNAPAIPTHFVALYFDDLVMPFSNIVYTRDAAERFLETELRPGDRVGIFTSSGVGQVDFTANRKKLDKALAGLRPRSTEGPHGVDCPDLSDYEAYLIDQVNEPQALAVATQQVILCQCNGNAEMCGMIAQAIAKEAARTRWSEADYQVRNSLGGLDQLVARLALMPGRRTILFISPGFMELSELQELSAIIDHAVQEGVVINGLDSRGLWARMPGGNVSEPSAPPAVFEQLDQMKEAADEEDSGVLTELADGTGGIFFHNSNDYDAGFREAGGLPQLSYVLSFSPSNLKDNGQYHRLKVELAGAARRRGITIEARKGYFAPKKAPTAAVQAAQEIHDAVFSRHESQGLPLQVTTRFAKLAPGKANLLVTLRLGAQGMDLAKQGDRYVDEVTIATAVFDHNGRYLAGTEKKVNLRLPEADLKQVRASGLGIRVGFALAPGDYLVRDVVRDSDGVMSSVNNEVKIAF